MLKDLLYYLLSAAVSRKALKVINIKKKQHSKSFHFCLLSALVLLKSAQGYNAERKRVLPEVS